MTEQHPGCPRCAAPYDPEKQKIKLHGWTCGAYLHNQYGTLVTSLACRDREIEQLCERVESQAKSFAELTHKYDSAVAILQAQRWRFNNLNPQGATLIDLMNSWLDAELSKHTHGRSSDTGEKVTQVMVSPYAHLPKCPWCNAPACNDSGDCKCGSFVGVAPADNRRSVGCAEAELVKVRAELAAAKRAPFKLTVVLTCHDPQYGAQRISQEYLDGRRWPRIGDRIGYGDFIFCVTSRLLTATGDCEVEIATGQNSLAYMRELMPAMLDCGFTGDGITHVTGRSINEQRAYIAQRAAGGS